MAMLKILAAYGLNLAFLIITLNWLIALFWGELVLFESAKLGGRAYSSPALLLFLVVMAQYILSWMPGKPKPALWAPQLISRIPLWADRFHFRMEQSIGRINTEALGSIAGIWLPLKLATVVGVAALHHIMLEPTGINPGQGAVYDYGSWAFWLQWDSNHYISIARSAYVRFEQHAFFPLYPAAVALMAAITKLPAHLAALAVSNLSAALAIWVIYRAYAKELGFQSLRAFVILWAVWPGSFYFSTAYTESLYALLLALSLYALKRDSMAGFGIWGTLLCLCRPSGLLLAPAALAARLIRRPRLKPGLIMLFAPLLGLAAYAAYCHWDAADGLAFINAQKSWGRKPGFALATMMEIFRSLGGDQDIWSLNHLRTMIDGLMVLLSLGLSGLLWRRVGKEESLMVLFTLGLCLSTGSIVSLNRIMLSAYPIFLGLGLLLHQRQTLLLVSSVVLFGLNLASGLLYSLHFFVW